MKRGARRYTPSHEVHRMTRSSTIAPLLLLIAAAGIAAAAEESQDAHSSTEGGTTPPRHRHLPRSDDVEDDDGDTIKREHGSAGGAAGAYDCDVCSACFAKSAEVRAKELEWSSLFQIKGQVARKAKDDTAVADDFAVFKDWTWAGSADELRAEEKALLGELEVVNGELKAAHHEVVHARREFPVECEGDASPLASVRGRRTLTRLNPDLYPDRPDVSFVIQYFKQPELIKPLVDYYHSCTNGRMGDAAGDNAPPNPNPGITSELIVNVDNPDEATRWLEQQREKGDFVTLLFSPNIHETRGYNRAAGAASGRIVVFLQDDDVPSDGCNGWVKDAVALFDAHKRLGVLGMKKACFSRWGACGYANRDVKFTDPKTGLGFQFVSVADFSPLAVRRTTFMDVGMLDEGMAPAGESGILSDYEFCERSWGAGWQVGQMATAAKLKGCANNLHCVGGTTKGISHHLREKNQVLNAIPFDRRLRFREHAEIFEEVVRANTQLLKPASADVDPEALFAADKEHHYYKSHVGQPEPLAEEDKGTPEVRRADAEVVAPMPKKDPVPVSKNMRARGGRSGGVGLGRRGAARDGGGEETTGGGGGGGRGGGGGGGGEGKYLYGGGGGKWKNGRDGESDGDEPPAVARGNTHAAAAAVNLRAQEEAYWKKHDGSTNNDKKIGLI